MSIDVMNRVFNLPTERLSNPSHRLVLVILADHANEDGECWPKNSTVAAKAGLSVHRVKVIIRELEEHRLLERGRQRKRPDGSLGSRMMRLTVVPAPEDGGSPTTPPSDMGGASATPSPGEEGVAHDTPGGAPATPHEPPVEPPEPIEPSTRRDSKFDPVVHELCEEFADSVPQRVNHAKRKNVTNAWLTDMDRLIRIDGRDPETIRRAIDWLVNGTSESATWWASIVQSPRALRNHWDKMAGQAQRERKVGRRVDARAAQDSLFAAADRVASVLDANVD